MPFTTCSYSYFLLDSHKWEIKVDFSHFSEQWRRRKFWDKKGLAQMIGMKNKICNGPEIWTKDLGFLNITMLFFLILKMGLLIKTLYTERDSLYNSHFVFILFNHCFKDKIKLYLSRFTNGERKAPREFKNVHFFTTSYLVREAHRKILTYWLIS